MKCQWLFSCKKIRKISPICHLLNDQRVVKVIEIVKILHNPIFVMYCIVCMYDYEYIFCKNCSWDKLSWMDTPGEFFTRETTFVTSCLLCWTPVLFWKGVHSKRTEFPFKVDPFSVREANTFGRVTSLKVYPFHLKNIFIRKKTNSGMGNSRVIQSWLSDLVLLFFVWFLVFFVCGLYFLVYH